jgi:TPR repeat protein
LRHGVGIAENDSESLKWLKLAADKGHVHAAYSYGLCCEEGAGTGIKNLREARSYYRKAASLGHREAAKRYMALSNDQ